MRQYYFYPALSDPNSSQTQTQNIRSEIPLIIASAPTPEHTQTATTLIIQGNKSHSLGVTVMDHKEGYTLMTERDGCRAFQTTSWTRKQTGTNIQMEQTH